MIHPLPLTRMDCRRSSPHRLLRRITSITIAATAVLIPQLFDLQRSRAESSKRPNIVLIMADDMGFECVGANGGETYATPRLDQLAASGMRFEHCYSQPICTPSRVQIMTGIYNSRNYVRFGFLRPGSCTFGNLLRDAGYATCIVGKWQLGGGFDAPYGFGFDEYCLWQLTRRPNRYPNPGLEINGKEVDFQEGQYGPDIVNDYACEFIRRQSKSEQPFFLYYPMILPHWPFEPTPDSPDWDPTFRRGDKTEKNHNMRSQKHFIEMVAYVDKIVGNVVDALDRHGLRENTLILFTADNGTYTSITSRFQGRDWPGGKGHMMDNGTHVALIASQPGTIPSGRVNHDLIDFSDFFPTLADTTGAVVPETVAVDGRSFLPQLHGKPGDPRDWIYCWYFRNGHPVKGGRDHSAGESARTHRYKLYAKDEFYDVTKDFLEREPLDPESLTAAQREVRDRLQQVIRNNTRDGFYGADQD